MSDLLREGYCVWFHSTWSPYHCFQSTTGVKDRTLRSTRRGLEIHFWPVPRGGGGPPPRPIPAGRRPRFAVLSDERTPDV